MDSRHSRDVAMKPVGSTAGDPVPGLEPELGDSQTSPGGVAHMEPKFFQRKFWTASRIRAVIWRGLAVLTCPCCIPIWLAVLAGTAIGGMLSRNLFITVTLFLGLFFYCFRKALRTYDQEGGASRGENGANRANQTR